MFTPLRVPKVPFVGVCIMALGIAAFPSPGTTAAADVDDEARSILAANCLKCHGPAKQKGGLRFDTRDGVLGQGDSGATAVAPGRSDASELIRRVTATDATTRMPLGATALTAAQIDTLRKWIEAGVAWPREGKGPATTGRTELIVTDDDRRHWAFQPLAKVELPAVTGPGRAPGPKTPIDRFILAGLAARGLTPAPPAD